LLRGDQNSRLRLASPLNVMACYNTLFLRMRA
jgi:hypothetical protein